MKQNNIIKILLGIVLLGVWGTFAAGLTLRQLADQAEAAALEAD